MYIKNTKNKLVKMSIALTIIINSNKQEVKLKKSKLFNQNNHEKIKKQKAIKVKVINPTEKNMML